jgi:hypothetical protein
MQPPDSSLDVRCQCSGISRDFGVFLRVSVRFSTDHGAVNRSDADLELRPCFQSIPPADRDG